MSAKLNKTVLREKRKHCLYLLSPNLSTKVKGGTDFFKECTL